MRRWVAALMVLAIVTTVLVAQLFINTRIARSAAIVVNSLADTVANDNACTLREAIQNANNHALTNPDCLVAGTGSDVISFIVGGVITLNAPLPSITNVTVLSINGGNTVTISGNNAVQIFSVSFPSKLQLLNLTLQNGKGGANNFSGGAINNGNGVVEISNTKFLNNTSPTKGGAIYTTGGQLTITGGQFNGNTTTMEDLSDLNVGGGAIFIDQGTSVTLNGVNFTSNESQRDGGAIYNFKGSITIGDTSGVTTFDTNKTHGVFPKGLGGAIKQVAGTLNIKRATFNGNTANNGGAISQESSSNPGMCTVLPTEPAPCLIIKGSTTDYIQFTNNKALWGGAIYRLAGLVTIERSHFTSNRATSQDPTRGGGAIYIDKDPNPSSTTITRSYFFDNTAKRLGGAILTKGASLVVQENMDPRSGNPNYDDGFYGNEATGVDGSNAGTGKGGAIAILGPTNDNVTIQTTRFWTNDATLYGGAIYNDLGISPTSTGNVTVDTVEFGGTDFNASYGNYADAASNGGTGGLGFGGAIYNDVHGSGLRIANSTFTMNYAQRGGVIFNASPNVILANSTLYRNDSTDTGGAIYVYGNGVPNFVPSVQLINTTLSSNTASNGAGTNVGTNIYVNTTNGNASVTLKNTIVDRSIVAGTNCSGNIIDAGNNVQNGDYSCGSNIVNGNPLLQSLNLNGGRTMSMALGTGSAAIDIGDDDACASYFIQSKDQRGANRLLGAHCDAGAYETGTFRNVTNALDNNTFGTLRNVITASNDGDTIMVDMANFTIACSTTPCTITLTTQNSPASQIEISKSLRIIGPNWGSSARSLIIDANHTNRVFWVRTGRLTINGMTLQNGRDTSGGDAGGNVYVDGEFTAVDSEINLGTACTGGAISNPNKLAIIRTTISANTATCNGGGINAFWSSTTKVANSTIANNTGSAGTAITSRDTSAVTIINSTVAGNFGGLFNLGTNPMAIINTIISANALQNCSGLITDGGNNVSYPAAISSNCPTSMSRNDPVLGPLQYNGTGNTKTMAIGTGSSAKDAGNNAVCVASPINNIDQIRTTRIGASAICDIGAYEVPAGSGLAASSALKAQTTTTATTKAPTKTAPSTKPALTPTFMPPNKKP